MIEECKKIVCDRCEKEIYIPTSKGGMISERNLCLWHLRSKNIPYDLCPECIREYKAMMFNYWGDDEHADD